MLYFHPSFKASLAVNKQLSVWICSHIQSHIVVRCFARCAAVYSFNAIKLCILKLVEARHGGWKMWLHATQHALKSYCSWRRPWHSSNIHRTFKISSPNFELLRFMLLLMLLLLILLFLVFFLLFDALSAYFMQTECGLISHHVVWTLCFRTVHTITR